MGWGLAIAAIAWAIRAFTSCVDVPSLLRIHPRHTWSGAHLPRDSCPWIFLSWSLVYAVHHSLSSSLCWPPHHRRCCFIQPMYISIGVPLYCLPWGRKLVYHWWRLTGRSWSLMTSHEPSRKSMKLWYSYLWSSRCFSTSSTCSVMLLPPLKSACSSASISSIFGLSLLRIICRITLRVWLMNRARN